MRRAAAIETTRRKLAAPDGKPPQPFDPATLDGLPAPARRHLTRVIPAGTPLATSVELAMCGEIKLGARWFRFRASQILRSGVGFVWQATVGGRLLRFTGADVLDTAGGRLEFRLHGLLPVARADGPDVTRSGAGRLTAETVAWLPQALTPQVGAGWTAIDETRAMVTIPGASAGIAVTLSIDTEGRLADLRLDRWNDSHRPPQLVPFGAAVHDEFTTAAGVRIAGAGVVGWGWGTADQADGEFFRYTITAERPPR